MRITNILLPAILCISCILHAQVQDQDTSGNIAIEEVVVTANRVPILLKFNPGAVSLVSSGVLSSMPKTIGAEEALRFVPGVRIDNQHDGERVHISIRGQGILTERGLRGIGVLIDGIPVNDPSGFAPDLYDVDWNNVSKIEVLRGPSAGLYGGSGAAGLINISTLKGEPGPLGGKFSQSSGSNGFFKSYLRLGGSAKDINYNLSYSRGGGDGYRDHQGFRSNKLYTKLRYRAGEKLALTQVISHTEYFQQNPEGLNIGQFGNLRQANPDARPFNEYQKTNRTTIGFTSDLNISEGQEIQFNYWYRTWNYKETSNRCAEYRNYVVPGLSAQYNLHGKFLNASNFLGIGMDLKYQDISMYKLQSQSNPGRPESMDDTNIETDSLLANQLVRQGSRGTFLLFRLEAGKFNLIGNVRYDGMKNHLTDKMLGKDTAKVSKNFERISARAGASWNIGSLFTLFANWSQGFLPPSTEELASNPMGYSGFNTHLVPAVSNCLEIGSRGYYNDILQYEFTVFMMKTKNDFFRFKQSGRGNQEVFYGNAGNSSRKGTELFLSYIILPSLSLQTSYTFSDFRYTSASIDTVYTDQAYVLTTPPSDGQWLTNSPRHQLYSELIYSFRDRLKLSLGTEYQSKWAIYSDARAYHGEMDPAIYRNWQEGFNLLNTRLSYSFEFWKIKGDISCSVRNLGNQRYMAFTEPDPDGNSYHPGPGREFFACLSLAF